MKKNHLGSWKIKWRNLTKSRTKKDKEMKIGEKLHIWLIHKDQHAKKQKAQKNRREKIETDELSKK